MSPQAAPAGRPRIVTIVPGLRYGGAEIGLLRLVRASAADFDHQVIALKRDGPLAADFLAAGAEVVELDLSSLWLHPWRLATLVQTLRVARPAVLVAHMTRGALLAALVRPLVGRRIALVWVFHQSLDMRRRLARSARWSLAACRVLAGAAQRIVHVSERSRADHIAYGFPAGRSIVLGNGIDTEAFAADQAVRGRVRSEWGFGPDDIVIGHVARVDWTKDHATSLAAFEIAADADARLRLVLCGQGTEALAVPSRLAARVIRLGTRRDVAAVMNGCEIGLLSSITESLPNVLLEWMACQRPVVTTDVGDSAAVCAPYGRAVPSGRPDELAAALLEIAALGPAERAELGRRARAAVIDRFAISRLARSHERMWRELIDARSTEAR
ncbi:MAG TPA: glycosyltransferase [Candidatus Limnocylindrales bacterium]